MTEEEFLEFLSEALEMMTEQESPHAYRWRTFEETMLLTQDKGLVVKMDDGSEFQVTVVRSA